MVAIGSISPRPLSRGQRDAANLYIARSVKLGRDVEVIGPASYEYWLLLEWNPRVAAFCERPNTSLLGKKGSSRTQESPQPDFWVRESGARQYYVVLTSSEALAKGYLRGELSSVEGTDFQSGEVAGLECRWIPDSVLRQSIVGIRNRKHLIHFVTEFRSRPRDDLYDAVRSFLAKVDRPLSWGQIEGRFEHVSIHALRCAIAALVFDLEIKCDLDEHLLSPATLLEAAK